MKRRHAVGRLLAFGAVLISGAAFAASVEEQVVAQLRALGYSDIRISRTLLGRLRFTAQRDDHSREIIINPNTGEILRDFVDSNAGVRIIDRSGGGDERNDDDGDTDDGADDRSGRGGDDDDADDDNSGPGGGDDDDRDDDNSGHGGGDDGDDDDNSGSGGGGDDGGDDDDPDDD